MSPPALSARGTRTGRNIHLALLAGALCGEGYGRSLGRFIVEDGVTLPTTETLERSLREEPDARGGRPARRERPLVSPRRRSRLRRGESTGSAGCASASDRHGVRTACRRRDARRGDQGSAISWRRGEPRFSELRLDLTDSDYEALDLSFKLGALGEADGAPEERGARLLEVVKTWSDTARHTSARDAALAALIVDEARDRVVAATADYDVIIAPVMPVPTFPADHFGPSGDVSPLYHCVLHRSGSTRRVSLRRASAAVARRRAACRSGSRSPDKRFRDADVLRVGRPPGRGLRHRPSLARPRRSGGDIVSEAMTVRTTRSRASCRTSSRGIEWTPALPTVASPSWVGGDSIFFEGRTPGGVPLARRASCGRRRPSASTAPRCSRRWRLPDPPGWRPLRALPRRVPRRLRPGEARRQLADRDALPLARPSTRGAPLCAPVAEFHELALDLPSVSVFDQIATLLAYARDNAVEIPPVAQRGHRGGGGGTRLRARWAGACGRVTATERSPT